MPHNVNFNEEANEYSFFSVNEKVWWKLGKVISEYPTSKQALTEAHLDYTVEKRPIFTFDKDNFDQVYGTGSNIANIKVPDFFATVRTDNEAALGVVGKDYEVVQNVDAFSFFDAIVGGGDGIMYETAGALNKGERIFITAKLPGYIRVGREDLTEKYLFLTTSHDGYGSITAAFTPIRIVCNNTLNAALRNHSNSIKIRHTANAKERLSQAHKLMGLSDNLASEMENIFNHWTKVRITDKEVRKLIQAALIPNKEILDRLQAGKLDEVSTYYQNMCDTAYEYAMTNPTQQQETTAGTLYGAYNGVTGYFQNARKYKDDTAKLKSQLYGGLAQQRSQAAFDLCTDFAANQIQFN
ncbi:MAG: DUF932 domain-containing protein [Bacteroidota bacterium]